jgi:hypothetical protein
MSYANYVPAKLGRVRNELQAALAALVDAPGGADALVFLETITKNASSQPGEAKFRRLREGNARVGAALAVPGARRALAALGWEADAAAPADDPALLLPRGKGSTADLREVIEAVGEARRAARRRPAGATAGAGANPDAAKVAAQLAADRAERAAAEPVAAPSKAVPLGGNGARVVSAGDLGANRG